MVKARIEKTFFLSQESYVQLTMLEEHLRIGSILKAMERSIHSARHCFTEYFYKSGKMKHVEYALLDSWYQFLTNSESTGFDTEADMIFYLQTDPQVAYERVKSRGIYANFFLVYFFSFYYHLLKWFF